MVFSNGHVPWNKGKTGHLSEESRALMSASAIGRNHTEETKTKMSTTRKGKKRPEEVKRKVSEGLKRAWAEGRR